jgi:hypothetical protein
VQSLLGSESAGKFQIRNPKHETNLKSKFSNGQKVTVINTYFFVLVIKILKIRICFVFRYSDFGFELCFGNANIKFHKQ